MEFLKKAEHKISDFFTLLRFRYTPVEPDTVLLIEPNECHAEVLPSFIKYLKDSGLKVDVAVNYDIKCFLPKLDAEKVYPFGFYGSRKIFECEKIYKYRFILFTSYRFYYRKEALNRDYCTLLEHYNIDETLLKKTGAVFHHTEDIENPDAKRLMAWIVLSDSLKQGETLGVFAVNPWYFKETRAKKKNDKTIFAISGALAKKRRNPELLFGAVRELLKGGVKNFRVDIAGANPKDCVPEDLRGYIKIKGRLDFNKMYKMLEGADFYLPLLDPEIPEHLRYINSGTSGSFQLIRGFLLPPVVHKVFAVRHGFDDGCALVYDDNKEFAFAMKRAIEMKNDEYARLQGGVLKEREEIYARSLEEVKRIISLVK